MSEPIVIGKRAFAKLKQAVPAGCWRDYGRRVELLAGVSFVAAPKYVVEVKTPPSNDPGFCARESGPERDESWRAYHDMQTAYPWQREDGE